jgi:hypothetical protein
LDPGDQQQLRIIGAGGDVISSIKIQLDRADELIPTFADEFDALSLDLQNHDGQASGTWRINFGYGRCAQQDTC